MGNDPMGLMLPGHTRPHLQSNLFQFICVTMVICGADNVLSDLLPEMGWGLIYL